jgi:hypothetical protein
VLLLLLLLLLLVPVGLKKLDLSAVQAALRDGADPNMTNSEGDTALIDCWLMYR